MARPTPAGDRARGRRAVVPGPMRMPATGPIALGAGARLQLSADAGPWRVASGLLTARHDLADGFAGADVLLRAGDLIGLETLAGGHGDVELRALVPSSLSRDPPVDEVDAAALLAQGYLQSRRQGAALVALRSGPVRARVARLLWSVAEAGGADDAGETNCELPSLRQCAAIVDSTAESVSRVLSELRREGVIGARDATRVPIRRNALWAIVAPVVPPG